MSINYEDIEQVKVEKLNIISGKIDKNKLNIFFSSLFDNNSSLFLKQNEKYIENDFYLQNNCENNIICLTTSGSTGTPKLIAYDKNIFRNKFQNKNKKYKTCLFMPWYHIGGLDTLLYSIANNSTCYIPENYNIDYFLNFIFKNKIEVLAITPSYLNLILLNNNVEKYFEYVKIITCGAEPFIPSVLAIKKICPWIKIIQKYGTTETGVLNSRTAEDNPEWIEPYNDGSWKIVDNILHIKSDKSYKWMYSDGVKKYPDEWLSTGDYIVKNDLEQIKILGRKNEIIIVGGRNVFPQEVRNAILILEEIDDAYVYGEKNILMGEIVCADMVLSKEISKINIAKKLIKLIDPHKVPVKINFVDKIEYNDRHKLNNKKIGL